MGEKTAGLATVQAPTFWLFMGERAVVNQAVVPRAFDELRNSCSVLLLTRVYYDDRTAAANGCCGNWRTALATD